MIARRASAALGGHICAGLEDNFYADPLTQRPARGNGELVEKALQIARLAGRELATPA